MSDKSAWDRLMEQITSPWDWVAAGVGAIGGGVVTTVLHGADLGTSVGAGAIAAVTARKAAAASLQGRKVKKRARALKDQVEKHAKNHGEMELLLGKINGEISLWESGAATLEDFLKNINQITDEYRKIVSNSPHLFLP
jgi:hypothetical protein